MSDDRPRFTRKSRSRLDAAERARMIADLARDDGRPPETFDLPHISDTPPEVGKLRPADPDPVAEAERDAEEAFAATRSAEEAAPDLPSSEHDFTPAPDVPDHHEVMPQGAAPETAPEAHPADESPTSRRMSVSVADLLAHDREDDTAPMTETGPTQETQFDAWPDEATDDGLASGPEDETFVPQEALAPIPDLLAELPVEPEPLPDADGEPDTPADTFAAPEPEQAPPEPSVIEPEVEPKSEIETEVEPEPEIETEVEPEPEPETDTFAEPNPTPVETAAIVPEPEATAIAEPEPDTQSAVGSTPEPEIQPEPEPASEPATPPVIDPGEVWAHLGTIPIDPAHLERNLIITAGRHDPAHGAFDVLRTRLVQTLFDNDWKRVAVTSPTRDCGKTFTAVNLAISLSRYEAKRTVLMDMDMRNPSVASVLGAPNPTSMGDFLQGALSVHDHFLRLGRNSLNIGNNLAVGLNDRIEPYASELMQDPRTDAALARMMAELDPDVVLYDLPPALAYDDVIAFKKHFDGVLMVIGGGTTTADEVHEAMRRLGEDVPLLGVVLNQADNETRKGYSYGY